MKESSEHKTLRLACETLQLILSAHLSMLTAILASGERCGAKVLRAARGIHRTIRQHLKVLYQLRAQALQSDLKTNPNFRAQVARDLGGTLALVRWERRRRSAKVHQQFLAARRAQGLDSGLGLPQELINSNTSSSSSQDISKHASGASETKPRKAWAPKTDRTGHFRLAVIPTGPKDKRITTRTVKVKRRSPSLFHPIEVTASELRRPAFTSLSSPYNSYPPNIDMPVAGTSPPIERPPIN